MKGIAGTVLFVGMLASVASAAPLVVSVRPEGDGQSGRDRYGYGFPWENVGFDSAACPNWAGHWYDAPYGSSRNVYLQVALPAALTAPAQIQQATLNLHITQIDGEGSSLYHVTSAAATGLASQELAGDVMVADLHPSVVATGWVAVDVTDAIRSDVAHGYAWAAFSLPSKGYSGLAFDSGDNTAGLAPYLTVGLVPEPAGLALVAVVAAGVARRGRRRADGDPGHRPKGRAVRTIR